MPEAASLKTLIVDDELPARELLQTHAARRPDLRVVGEAEDGPSAVEAIRRLSPDLVLLDVEMPSLDGFAVLDEVDRQGLPPPRVIYVTAFDRYAVRAFDVNAVEIQKRLERRRAATRPTMPIAKSPKEPGSGVSETSVIVSSALIAPSVKYPET